MTKRKGIILAGGSGTRLYPLTKTISKQLLPVYDKPMIYYPLSTLMSCGINDILIISTPRDINNFEKLLGNGSEWGIKLSYMIQPNPGGIAQAILLAEDFIKKSPCALILGDNIFYGNSIQEAIITADSRVNGATVFVYQVKRPEQYGVVTFDNSGKAISIEEKPHHPKSNYAVTGLYLYDEKAVKHAKSLTPSDRGELEITDLNSIYLSEQKLSVEIIGNQDIWFDTGTHKDLLEAQKIIGDIQNTKNIMISYPEQVAFLNNWIDKEKLKDLSNKAPESEYGRLLTNFVRKIP